MPFSGLLSAAADLTTHRARIARVLLVGFAVLGLIAYLPSVWLSIEVGLWGIAVLDTVLYGAILGVLAFGRSNYRLQAGVVVGVSYLLGVGLSVLLGPEGAGPLWLFATPIAAAILFDRRAALGVLALVTASAAAITLFAFTAEAPWAAQPATSPLLWMVLAANALLVGGALTLAVTTLIRELQREMAERQRAESQLRQAEKLQAIGTLAAGIAHDFNNLLTPILSATEMAHAETREDSARSALDQAIEAAVAGRLLVRRILAFSRPSGGGRMAMRASDAFRDAVRLLRASIPGSISVNLHTAGDGVIMLSPGEVHQIVLNLGTNAQKAMPAGGTLDFRLLAIDSADAGWHGAAPAPGPLVRLEVSDTGSGMSPEIASRIFEPFFTTDPDRGTGIGLPTVHGIVTSAGGQIACRSEPGRGATFTLDFPALPAELLAATSEPIPSPIRLATPLQATQPPPSPVRHSTPQHAPLPTPIPPTTAQDGAPPLVEPVVSEVPGRHILLVDDEKAVRDVTQRMLQRKGFRVTSVADADAALDRLRHGCGDFALVLSDLHMPGMTGLQLAERLRIDHPALAIILMSGLVDEELEAEADRTGVDCVLAKPFRLHELTDAVQRVCAV